MNGRGERRALRPLLGSVALALIVAVPVSGVAAGSTTGRSVASGTNVSVAAVTGSRPNPNTNVYILGGNGPQLGSHPGYFSCGATFSYSGKSGTLFATTYVGLPPGPPSFAFYKGSVTSVGNLVIFRGKGSAGLVLLVLEINIKTPPHVTNIVAVGVLAFAP